MTMIPRSFTAGVFIFSFGWQRIIFILSFFLYSIVKL
jgi:hypothetical protein